MASSPSSIKLSPSLSFSFHLSPLKRHCFTTISIHNSSSSTPSSGVKARKNSSNLDVSRLKRTEALGNGTRNKVSQVDSVSSNRSGLQKKQNLSFKALIGRKSGRRLWFASKRVRGIILLNIITFVYASNIPVLKQVEAITDPAAFTVVRFALAAIPFMPFVFQAWEDVHIRNAGIELGFWVSLGYLMQAIGLQTSEAGRASFICMFTVIVVPLLDGMLGATVPAYTWFGALMSILGVGMLESSGPTPSIGDLLNFLSAVFFGIHMLRTEHLSRSTNKKNFLSLLGYELCVIAFFSTIWYFAGGLFGGIPSPWTWTMLWRWVVSFPWISAVYTGIFSTGLCLWIEMTAMCDVSATETAIIYGLEPVWGAGFAWFLLGERWGATGWIGAALVLSGSLMVQILGSSSPGTTSSEDEERSTEVNHLLVSDNQNDFPTSPAILNSRKDNFKY